MRKIKKTLTLLFSTFLVFSLFSGFSFNEAHACSCIAPDEPKKEKEKFEAVFSGKVVNIEEKHHNEPIFSSMDPVLVTIDVDTIWKGLEKRDSTVTVSTSVSSASCGFYFEENTKYVVYANKYSEDKLLQVSLCSRTNTIENATYDLKELGEGIKVSSDNTIILPPLKQQKMVSDLDEIKCKSHLTLIFKKHKENPACVKPLTAEKLIQRGGWTNNFTSIDSTTNNQKQSIQSESYSYEDLCGFQVTDKMRLKAIYDNSHRFTQEGISYFELYPGNFTHITLAEKYPLDDPHLNYWFELENGNQAYFRVGACDIEGSEITRFEVR